MCAGANSDTQWYWPLLVVLALLDRRVVNGERTLRLGPWKPSLRARP